LIKIRRWSRAFREASTDFSAAARQAGRPRPARVDQRRAPDAEAAVGNPERRRRSSSAA